MWSFCRRISARLGTPPESLRAFPLKGDAASAAGRPLRGGCWRGARQFYRLEALNRADARKETVVSAA
ncbi:hypothetical protein DBR12_08975 [Acidovorax sp. HMWF029]|nr:hypothetical protein DBR12_08975 [Acidovorax sp. HMWF029]